MQKTKKQNQKKYFSQAALLGIFSLTSLFSVGIFIGNATANTQDKLDELNARAAVYRQIIDIKKKQSETLGNKISSMDSNIKEIKNQIQDTENQIDGLNSQIGKLETQIDEKKTLINVQRKILVQVIQAYYQISQASPVAIYLAEDNLASFMVNKDRVSQTGDKIKATIDSINELKAEIEKQSDELSKRRGEVVNAHQDLQNKNDNFQSIKDKQTSLLAQTQDEAAQYAQLLKRIDEQKAELLDFSAIDNISSIIKSIENYPKPDQKYWNVSAYYSQGNSKWGSKKIGNSSYSMAKYGCAITSVAMAYKFNGKNLTPLDILNKTNFTQDGLIYWPADWDNIPYNDKDRIDSELSNKNVVIVHIKTSSGPGHYVVIYSKDSYDYIVHDPYFGANLYLKTSMSVMSASTGGGTTKINQMIIPK